MIFQKIPKLDCFEWSVSSWADQLTGQIQLLNGDNFLPC